MTPEWSAILSEFTRGFKSAASSARNASAQLPRSVMRAGALAVRAAFLAANGHEEVARGDANNLGAEHHPTPRRCLCEQISIDVRSCANMPLPPPRSHVKRNSNSGQHRRSGAID